MAMQAELAGKPFVGGKVYAADNGGADRLSNLAAELAHINVF